LILGDTSINFSNSIIQGFDVLNLDLPLHLEQDLQSKKYKVLMFCVQDQDASRGTFSKPTTDATRTQFKKSG